MNKSDLIKALATRENLTEREATGIINLIFEGFQDALQDGDRIELRGFGSFSVRECRAYTGRNPRTGGNVEVAVKRLPYFRAGKGMNELIAAERKE